MSSNKQKTRKRRTQKTRQGKARQQNLIRKMLCRPELPAPALQAAAAAAGCVRHDEPAAGARRVVALAGRVRRPCWHAHWPAWPQEFQCAGWTWRSCRSSGACSGCSLLHARGGAVRAVRRGDRAARGWRRAELSGSGVLGVLKNLLLPLKTLAKKLGGEALATARGVVHSGSPARCVHAGSTRFLVCAASRRHARASLTLAACGSQRSQSSLVLDERPICPPHALRITACSLACSVLCAPSALSLMSVLAVSPRPRKGLLTLSSLLHQLSQVRADGPIRRARDDSVPRRCAWRSRCRRRRGRRR